MTEEELEVQFVRAEQAVDTLLNTWKANKTPRKGILEGFLATSKMQGGNTMQGLCFAVMAERLIKADK